MVSAALLHAVGQEQGGVVELGAAALEIAQLVFDDSGRGRQQVRNRLDERVQSGAKRADKPVEGPLRPLGERPSPQHQRCTETGPGCQQ